ncbi:hypothetical protein [Clostridium beijerinckii]|uniref:HNH endonuclease n=1 Tax=Clostridium beijerinckii TaxID=1520 RepID=A0AAX0B0S9_CLOBE|nr:hypothetical protein [Clostridium beijerinckii]NRT88915.1 hypothetical protein [Clostridium beijerinckii]NYC74370.1 hypothetical protein [Clostridium beijerinckii]
MERRFEKCNNCKYKEIEEWQLILMLGMSDANILYQDYCEEQYEDIKHALEGYVISVEPYLKDSVDNCLIECQICKSKKRVEKFKEYSNKMIKIINSDRYYYVEKLQRIYFLQDDYFEDCDRL